MFGFIINIPYTLVGLLLALLSFPISLAVRKKPYAMVLRIKSFWWSVGYLKHARAMTIGHVVLLGPNVKERDLEHELVHVEQYQKMPLIQPALYYIEFLRKGYRDNKYEVEAYKRAGNLYKEN